MSGSWKTNVAGIATIVGAICAALKAQFDNDPSTVADWPLVVAAVTGGIGLLFARDNNVTSEDVGAK